MIDMDYPIAIKGARIDGDLKMNRHHDLEALAITQSVINGNADFFETTFTNAASFFGTIFRGVADFEKATFSEGADFSESSFDRRALFGGAVFTRRGYFNRATFAGDAIFSGLMIRTGLFNGTGFIFNNRSPAIFADGASFSSATFNADVQFYRVPCTSAITFDRTNFAGDANFQDSTFSSNVSFRDAKFFLAAEFEGATFSEIADFEKATFAGRVTLRQCRCRVLRLRSTTWTASDVDTSDLVALSVDLANAAFEAPARLTVCADRISARYLRSIARLHLVIAAARIDLTDADLGAGSLIESAPVTKDSAEHRVVRPRRMLIHDFLGHYLSLRRLEGMMSARLAEDRVAAIVSFERAHVNGVRLSGISLRECTFESTDGLDSLLIDDSCILRQSKDEASPRWSWLCADRRSIYDEVLARGTANGCESVLEEQTGGQLDSLTGEPEVPPHTPVATPTAAGVSATYRSLRKALEDAKDEPGAADFYYGEMEMRRRAAKTWSVERQLLGLYWLISGYGLRAWRALTSLVVVIGLAGWCFTNSEWLRTSPSVTSPSIDPHGAAWPWLFATQETVALLRPAGATGVTLVGFGALVDIAIRILGPVLLALGALAIRNRTKR